MAPKGGDKSGGDKEEDQTKALLKLSVKYANSAAFQDLSDSRISAEQVNARNPGCNPPLHFEFAQV